MKRFATLLVAGALLVPVSIRPADADHDCDPGQGFPPAEDLVDARVYSYCGEHPRASDLPLTFRINVGSRPAGLQQDFVRAAASDAILEWNSHWPYPASGQPLCPVLCPGPSTNKLGVNFGDEENTISWSEDLTCESGDEGDDALAVACVRYARDRHHILEVDIVLDKDAEWYQPSLTGEPPTQVQMVVGGEVAGTVYPELGNNSEYSARIGHGRDKQDVQSVLTHELGHALGLRDIGASEAPWPHDPEDAWKYQETMYAYSWPGTTNKRTLHAGDIAGLTRIALDVMTEG